MLASRPSAVSNLAQANNDKNQDPCTIGAWLLSPCLGNPGDAIVDALNSTLAPGTYGPPIRPDQCGCSMVYYNIIQACGACQGGRITS
ncbi:hypothetical protein PsYK624_111310 [Phanerochaete sordida]|uniref:Uncharacterized protein n=1 Tax=Phanerochaete sordida TaxID=48140 RepID=A0A9P3GH81_9APHY|nr:hypothetical protein PsYK624_111310 [Phanerochaete sordida]